MSNLGKKVYVSLFKRNHKEGIIAKVARFRQR